MATSTKWEARAAAAKRVRALESELQALHAAAGPDDDERGDGNGGVPVAADDELLTRPPAPNMDPFACLCWCKFKRIGQSYVLHESRRLRDGRVVKSMVIVGPHWIGVIVTLAILLVATGAFLQQQCTTLPWYYTLATLAFFSVTLYYLFETACRDPGIVLPSWYRDGKDDGDGDRDDEMANVESDLENGSKSASPPPSGDGNELLQEDDDQLSLRSSASTAVTSTSRYLPKPSGVPERVRFCDICDAQQAPFTEHCDDCDVCVAEYDHHCPWMGKCIGKGNMRAFKLFNISWVLYAVFVVSVAMQNVDWGDVAVQQLQRAADGSWVPVPRGGRL